MRIADIKSLMRQRGLAVAISTLAVALLVFHALFPNFVIDGVTLALLVLAALPWLGSSWIKSIEFAGVKLELRELKDELVAAKSDLHRLGDELTEGFEAHTKQQDLVLSRVTEIESLLRFSGIEVGDQREMEITKRVREFLAYLRERGARFDDEPEVEVVEGTRFGQSVHYDPETNQLVVGLGMIGEDGFILRECCFCVFHGPLGDAGVKAAVGELAISGPGFDAGCLIAGLGYYFVCSFKNDARFVAQGMQILDLERPEVSAWARYLVLRPSPDMAEQERLCLITAIGDRWAHLLWGLRAQVGGEVMDKAILETWNELNRPEAFGLDQAMFRAELGRRLATRDPAAAAALDDLAEKLLDLG